MNRFRNILVVTSGKDGGEAAIGQAAELAKQSGAKITLVDAIEALPESMDVAGTEPAERHRLFSTQKLTELGRQADGLRQQGLKVAFQLLQGDPSRKTIECVITQNHDLVIKSADQPAGLAQRLFGTLGQRLFRRCPCPVWIIKSEPAPRLNRILVAVDPFPVQKDRNPMNVAIMEMATSLARTSDSELHIVYAWPKWTQWSTDLRDLKNTDRDAQDENKGDALQEATLEPLVGPFRDEGHCFETHLLRGNAGDVVTRLAHQLNVDLLVMGTVAHNNFVLFSIGSTAEHILDHVNCSVLAFKPSEFLPSVFPKPLERGHGFSFS